MTGFPYQRFTIKDFNSPVEERIKLHDEMFDWLKENVVHFTITGNYKQFRVTVYSDVDATAFKLKFGI